MVDQAENDIGLMNPSDALELLLDMAQRQADRERHLPTLREAERLYMEAALEQLDHLLHDYWEVLDAIPHAQGRHSDPPKVRGEDVWWVRDRIPVEQRSSDAVRTVIALVERGRRTVPASRESIDEVLSWSKRFVDRYATDLDRVFGQTV